MKHALSLTAFAALCAIPAVAAAQQAQAPTTLSAVGSFETPVVIIPAETAASANVQFGVSNAITIQVSEDAISNAINTFAQSDDDLLNLVALATFGQPAGAGESISAGPGADLPSVGTATFSGKAVGSTTTETSIADVSGDVGITVDFASGSVDSTFTNMIKQELAAGSASGPLGATAWKDFSSTGSLVEGTGLFSGDAATVDGTLSGTVAGALDGTESATGLWSLTGTGESAFGAFTASAN